TMFSRDWSPDVCSSDLLARAVRLRRRRRRAESRDDRGGEAAAVAGGVADGDTVEPGTVLRGGGGGVRRPAGVDRGDVPRVPPRRAGGRRVGEGTGPAGR